MDGRKLYNEIEDEKNTEAGLGLLIIDAPVMIFIGYFYLSWWGVAVSAVLIFVAYKSPKILLYMIFVVSITWGLVGWKISEYIASFFFEPALSTTIAVIFGVIVGLAVLGLHMKAYERIQEWFEKRERREVDGHLSDSGADESTPTTPSESRKDYSEYERKGFVVRDYRAGRDRNTEREEDR